MKKIRIYILMALLFTGGFVHAEGTHEAKGHEHDKEAAADFLGVSLDISTKVQAMTCIRSQPAVLASSGATVAVAGRLVENMEEIIEVIAGVKGKIQEYVVPLGAFVAKDKPIAKIQTAEKTIVDLKSPAEGVLVAQFISQGESVDTASAVVMLADLSRLAAHVDIYEKDIALVRAGQRVLVRVSAYPGEMFEGVVDFVSPRIDETSVTLKMRVQVNNNKRLLKPGMFVQGDVLVDDNRDYLIVAADALQTIEGIEVVFVHEGETSFVPVKVESRPAVGRQMLIKGDIKAGDRIVTEGSFILKSKILEDEIAGGHCH